MQNLITLTVYFGEFEPAEGLLVEFVLQLGQALALLGEFVDGEGTAAEGLLQLVLLGLEGSDVTFQLLELALLLIRQLM